jgi:hypothetical protein
MAVFSRFAPSIPCLDAELVLIDVLLYGREERSPMKEEE